MLLHDLEFLGTEAARLVQDRFRDAQLADVMQRHGLRHQGDIDFAQFEPVRAVKTQFARQRREVALGAAHVARGVGVPRFGQASNCNNGSIADLDDLFRSLCNQAVHPTLFILASVA